MTDRSFRCISEHRKLNSFEASINEYRVVDPRIRLKGSGDGSNCCLEHSHWCQADGECGVPVA